MDNHYYFCDYMVYDCSQRCFYLRQTQQFWCRFCLDHCSFYHLYWNKLADQNRIYLRQRWIHWVLKWTLETWQPWRLRCIYRHGQRHLPTSHGNLGRRFLLPQHFSTRYQKQSAPRKQCSRCFHRVSSCIPLLRLVRNSRLLRLRRS